MKEQCYEKTFGNKLYLLEMFCALVLILLTYLAKSFKGVTGIFSFFSFRRGCIYWSFFLFLFFI